MSPIRTFRWLSMGLIAAAFALAATAGMAGAASSWGEIGRFGGVDKISKKGHKFLLEEAHAFGVDPASNTVYVGDEKNENEENQEFRLQQYNETGTFQAEGIVNPHQKKGPPGLEKIEELEGIAIDSAEKRLYVLETYARPGTATIDPEVPVAGTLYAFSTTAVGGKLVPAEGVGIKPGGVVAEPKELNAESEVPGKPLLNPSGLTVDPVTHEVLILGQVDKGPAPSGEMHVAIDRVSKTGGLVGTWEDPTPVIEEAAGSNSPVASTAGRVYFESENQIMQVPQGFAAVPPKPVFKFAENSLKGVFHEEILNFGNLETFYGGALAIQNEGVGAGTFFAYGEGGEMDEAGKVTTLRNIAIGVKFTEEGETVKTSELGWTGGVVNEEAKPCAIEFGGHGYTQVAMGGGTNTAVFALTSGRRLEIEESEVVKFGPGGSGCPGAVVKQAIEPTINGGKVIPDTTAPVTLVAKVQGANVLGTKWSFGDGTPEATETAVPGQQSQAAEMQHKFAKTGIITVQATIVTDDLATPEIKVTTPIEVTGPGLKIIQQPTNREVVVGEPATFEVKTMGGEAPIKFQWEKRKTATEKEEAIPGATGEKLTTPPTALADSGSEYRVTVTPSSGKPVESSWAKLKVVPPAPPTVTSQPASVAVTEGQTASFEAIASGAPQPKVQWETSANGVSWAAVPGAEAPQLVISHTTTVQNGLKYRALFTNEFAGTKHQATSAVATLTVNAKPPSLPLPLPPPPGSGSGPGPQGGVQGVQEQHTPVATIAGLSLSVNAAGAVPVKISCPAGETVCSGTVTLRTLTAVSAGARAAKTKGKKAILMLASASFSVSGGSVKVVTLHLSAKARRLLARAHRLRARATVLAHDPAGASNTALSVVTLTLAKPKRKH